MRKVYGCTCQPLGRLLRLGRVGSEAAVVNADDALAELFERTYPSLVGTARLLLDDRAQAEEVVQEAFVRVRLAWWRVRDPERAAAYLRRAVVNLARSGLRRRAVARLRDPQHARANRLTVAASEDTAVPREERRTG